MNPSSKPGNQVEPRSIEEVRQRIACLEDDIASACTRASRSRKDIHLVAVSKTKPVELITQFASLGIQIFGENYVQEALLKQSQRPDLDWHFIGSLQTNKVKQILGRFQLIHSVDRLKLLSEILKVSAQHGIRQEILLQVQIGNEANKSGAEINELMEMLELHGAQKSDIVVRGLMCLPPLSSDESVSRGYFAQLRDIYLKLQSELSDEAKSQFSILSMGTSGDFQAAILEGATHIRVGSNLFGTRN